MIWTELQRLKIFFIWGVAELFALALMDNSSYYQPSVTAIQEFNDLVLPRPSRRSHRACPPPPVQFPLGNCVSRITPLTTPKLPCPNFASTLARMLMGTPERSIACSSCAH